MMYKKLGKFAVAAVCLTLTACICESQKCEKPVADLNTTRYPAEKLAKDAKRISETKIDAALFKNPPVEYKAVPFWSWNEEMTPEEVTRQVSLIKEGGWGGAFVHSRVGLITEYMSEEWFKAVDATLSACEKEGMLVWLYDEDKWPSGFSGGTVPLADPEFRQKALIARPVGATVPETAVKLGEPQNGLQIYIYTEPLGDPWFNGTSYVDMLDNATTDKFLKDAYESYYERYSDKYGTLIAAEFTDEPTMHNRSGTSSYSGAVAFSTNLIEEFKKMHGYDPIAHFYKLFVDCEGAETFRLHYYRTTNRMFELNYFKKLGDYCEDKGIVLTGHCMEEQPIYGQVMMSGRLIPYYRWYGFPGVDHLGRQIYERIGPKQVQSAVNQYGKPRMLTELYGCTGGTLSFEDRQWIANEQMALGANLLNPHLSLYSMTGCRKRDYPQNIYYQQSWWSLNSEVSIPLARASYILAQGKYYADTLVLTPIESLQAKWRAITEEGKHPRTMAKEVGDYAHHLEASYYDTTTALLSSQLTFDYGDEQILEEDGSVENDSIKIALMNYRSVVIPSMDTMRPSTLEMLKKFKQNGGLIVRTADAPTKLDGVPSQELVDFMNTIEKVEYDNLAAKLESKIKSAVKILSQESGDKSLLWSHVRHFADGSELVMLTNLCRKEAFKGRVALRGDFTAAKKLDPRTGDITDFYAEKSNGQLEVDVDIAEADALYLLLDKSTPVATKPVKSEIVEEKVLKEFAVKVLDDNSLTLDFASYSLNNGEEKVDGVLPVLEIQEYLNLKKYDGQLTLKYPFTVDAARPLNKIHLVVEYPERCQILVNDKEVKYEGLPFWRDFRWYPIDITHLIHNGENTIVLNFEKFEYGDLAVVSPSFKRYGTEIESVYLVGDFFVDAIATGQQLYQKSHGDVLKPPHVNTVVKKSLILRETKPLLTDGDDDLSLRGLPFYTGRIAINKDISDFALAEGEKVMLKADNLDVPIAEVFIDGVRAGVLTAHPLTLDITEFVQKGAKNVEIVLYSSLRNLMGPHHHHIGELFGVGPHSFIAGGMSNEVGARKSQLEKWAAKEFKPADWIEEYSIVSLGRLGNISLIKVK